MYFVCSNAKKVQLFWEGHKNVRNCPYGLEIYVKNMRTIAQFFVAFCTESWTLWIPNFHFSIDTEPESTWKFMIYDTIIYKVQLFWESQTNLRHPPYGFDIYLVNIKTKAF